MQIDDDDEDECYMHTTIWVPKKLQNSQTSSFQSTTSEEMTSDLAYEQYLKRRKQAQEERNG